MGLSTPVLYRTASFVFILLPGIRSYGISLPMQSLMERRCRLVFMHEKVQSAIVNVPFAFTLLHIDPVVDCYPLAVNPPAWHPNGIYFDGTLKSPLFYRNDIGPPRSILYGTYSDETPR